jgi:hypothetical protein
VTFLDPQYESGFVSHNFDVALRFFEKYVQPWFKEMCVKREILFPIFERRNAKRVAEMGAQKGEQQ